MFIRLAEMLRKQLILIPCFLLPWVMLVASFCKFSPWPYAQPPFIFLVFLCCLLATGLSLHSFLFFNRPNVRNEFTLNLDYASGICFGLAIWSALASYFSYIPWLSWVGAPQLGMGVIWYAALGVMVIGYRSLLNSSYLSAFIVNLVLASFIVSCISFIGDLRHGLIPNFKFLPYFINEHIVFIGIPILGLGFLLKDKNHKKILLILGGIIIAASTNRTGYLGVIVGSLLGGISYYISKKKLSSYYSRYFFASLIFLLPVFIYFMLLVLQRTWPDLSLDSLYVRYQYWRACIDTLINNPYKLLFGFGWGSYTDIILTNILNIAPKAIISPPPFSDLFLLPDISQTWQQLGLDINNLLGGSVGFHSHNQFIETLFSTGFIGWLLFSMLVILPVLVCSGPDLPAMVFISATLAFTLCGWYEIPGTLPYIAIFFATAVPDAFLRKFNLKSIFQFFMPIVAVILLVFGTAILYINLRFDAVRKKFYSKHPEIVAVDDYLESVGPGGNYLAILLRDFYRGVATKSLNPVDIKVLQNLLYAYHSLRNPSLVSVSSVLPIYNLLLTSPQDPRITELENILIQNMRWEGILETVITRWYVRADLLLPYFNWHLQHGRKFFVVDVIKNILEKHGDNPILITYLNEINKAPSSNEQIYRKK